MNNAILFLCLTQYCIWDKLIKNVFVCCFCIVCQINCHECLCVHAHIHTYTILKMYFFVCFISLTYTLKSMKSSKNDLNIFRIPINHMLFLWNSTQFLLRASCMCILGLLNMLEWHIYPYLQMDLCVSYIIMFPLNPQCDQKSSKATYWESGESCILFINIPSAHRSTTPSRWEIPDTGRINILSDWSKSVAVMVVSLEDWQGGIIWWYSNPHLMTTHSSNIHIYNGIEWVIL